MLLSVSVGDSPGAELIIICRTRQTPAVEIIPRFELSEHLF